MSYWTYENDKSSIDLSPAIMIAIAELKRKRVKPLMASYASAIRGCGAARGAAALQAARGDILAEMQTVLLTAEQQIRPSIRQP